MSLTTANGRKADYGAFDATDSMFAAEFHPDREFFFGFIGREELISVAGQPQDDAGRSLMLVSLGIVTYNFACLRDEKSRLGSDFFWGIESYIVESLNTKKVSGGAGTYPEVEVISKSFDFMEDLETWQRYLAYVTFGLNFLFLLCLLLWCCCRCRICCGGRSAEIQRFKMKLLNRQAQK